MNYKVLYRKYRPIDFENIIGQNYIITTLKNSIVNSNISHAYIFSGPRGTGKTSTAKVFSKAINCLNPIDGSPCNKCEFCANFQENPDVIEIDAASNNGVDEIRNLIDNIKLTPTNGKYKVYIIDEVHMLTTSAFNALLLTLEEPPAHAIFILATTNIENVPITILSRCQRYDFQKITVDNIVKRLLEVCEKERISADEDALKEIAYISEGGMRDALSLLDQLSKNNQNIDLELVESQIKTISQKTIIELLDTLEENSVEKCLDIIHDFAKRAIDYKTLLKKIIDVACNRAKNIKKNNKYERLNFEQYKNLILDLSECLTKININVNPYTIIEMILLDYLDTTSTRPEKKEEAEVKKDIILKEDSIEKNGLASSTDLLNQTSIDIRINNTFVNAQKKYLEEVKSKLNNELRNITSSGKIKSILIDCTVVAASDKNIIFSTLAERIADEGNKMLLEIEAVLQDILKEKYKIVFIPAEKWESEKQNYILNLKNNKKYEYIEEENLKTDKLDEDIINDIFDMSKMEVI